MKSGWIRCEATVCVGDRVRQCQSPATLTCSVDGQDRRLCHTHIVRMRRAGSDVFPVARASGQPLTKGQRLSRLRKAWVRLRRRLT